MRRSTVVTLAAFCPAACQAAQSMVAVVVLPSVPVIPATVIRREGCPAMVAASALRARRALSTCSRGVASGIAGTGVRSATTATAPARTAATAKS